MKTMKPSDEAEVVAAILEANVERRPLEIRGAGSKRAIGRPVEDAGLLNLSGLAGITLYEPDELVLSAGAGTPISKIHSALAEKGQELAFEPMDYGPLFGRKRGAGTIGGALAANLSGPRRIKAGAARDHFLGMKAVSGRGEAFKAGGRVMKNVTGYDLSKGVAGSWGTLVAMTEVTVKVMPRAETEASLVFLGLADEAASAAMSTALGSPFEISAAAHLPAPSLSGLSLKAGLDVGKALTVLRIEGFAPSVENRDEATRAHLKAHGAAELLTEAQSRALWLDIRDVKAFAGDGTPVWRISTAPSEGWKVAAAIGREAEARVTYDWGGGLVWLNLGESEDAGAALVRGALGRHGGHATLIRASEELRARVPVFQPQPGGLGVVTQRYKASFDPRGILNPGRMYEGM